MAIVLDFIVVGIILIITVISAKRGFIKVLIETVGFVLAIFLAFTISQPLADSTYDKFIEPPIVKTVSESGAQGSQEVADKFFEALPNFVNVNLDRFGVKTESVKDNITSSTQDSIENTIIAVSQDVIKPIAVKIIELIYSVIISIILMLFVKPVAKIINKLFSFSLVGKINTGLGAIVGLVQGTVFAILFCIIISTVVSFTQNGIFIFTPENIAASNIFKFFTQIF